MKHSIEKEFFILCLYGDDLLVTRKDEEDMMKFKRGVMLELGNLSYFFGMEFRNTSKYTFLYHNNRTKIC